ncbi:hypothetical protein [Flavobacterium kingsejongi]|uniref:Uncharacterized protein n=1 Tax=Flavobacterium kingsejongi TaxID=1678728 RepID=A0A2S1LNI6_9FLAO|nr:hypothetical protein [Flavobacterium kingsejongi]AWG25258.1 hypothetical protein FK004_08430 [Flavobacterium kingsejongi]
MSFLDNAISSIGQGLAITAAQSISDSTGVDVGGTLGFLFGGGQKAGGENIGTLEATIQSVFGGGGSSPDATVLAQLSSTLSQQQQAIANLGVQITGIANALSHLEGEIAGIESMLTKISQHQLFTDWNTIDIQLTEYIKAIDSCYMEYGMYVSQYATTPVNEVTYLVQAIFDPNTGPLVGMKTINALLMGGGGQSKGALQLWSIMVTPLIQDGTLDYRLAVEQYFQYYQKLAYAELKAANLLMEAYIYNGDKTSADNIWSVYQLQLIQQEDIFINGLIPLVYSGIVGGSAVGQYKGKNFTFFGAAMELNPGVQQVVGDSDPGNAFYAPSNIFQLAEQLLANLSVTAATSRRIVVHMLYSSGVGIPTLLSGLQLSLSAGNSGTTITPISDTVLGGPFDFPNGAGGYIIYPDVNFYTGAGFYVKRYVYNETTQSGLADTGTYTLSNLNGHDGLLPIQTYASQITPFQENSVIAYNLEVNPVSKFDFMNFMAYSVPMTVVPIW